MFLYVLYKQFVYFFICNWHTCLFQWCWVSFGCLAPLLGRLSLTARNYHHYHQWLIATSWKVTKQYEKKLALTGNSFTAHQQILKTAYNQSMFLNTGNPKLYHNWNNYTICMDITSNLVWNYDKYWAGIVGCLQSLTIPLFLFSFWVGSSGCLGYHHSPSMCPGVRQSDTKAPTRHPAQNYRNHQQVLQSLILYYVHFICFETVITSE